MIRYALACDAGHRFESWFGSSAAFDGLAGQGLVSCPDCGSTRVVKAIMAPAVARSGDRAGDKADAGLGDGQGHPGPPVPSAPTGAVGPPRMLSGLPDAHRELRAAMRALRSRVIAGTQDVGGRFPEEARRMHDGDIPHRDIRGEATLDEARSLIEDGIMILPLPGHSDELN